MYFILIKHLNSEPDFPQILDRYLILIKFTVVKVNSYTQLVPNMFKDFPITF
jgi:hypothetical protein